MQLSEALQRIEQLEKQLAAMMVRLEMSERRSEQYRVENERLRLRVADLEMRVRTDSDTSHRPPSMDPPWKKRHASKEPTGQKAGAKRGHKGVRRSLVPVEQVDEVLEHRPQRCEGCGQALGHTLPAYLLERVQLTEIPQIQAKIVEHRSLEVCCPHCRTRNAYRLPTHLTSSTSFTTASRPIFGANLSLCLLPNLKRILYP
ncbi:MAG: hypothetical protein H6715_04830 [Myxococcales bacterium]|nr:hypothetical protein [Myxococcales bacterium]MCB9708487.1 hypothetical protein [Myxococcales bacterium]